MAVPVGGYVVLVVARGGDSSTLVDDWVAGVAGWATAFVCWAAARRCGTARLDVALAAAAVTSHAVGDTLVSLLTDGTGLGATPLPADAFYLLFYALMLASLLAVTRRQLRTIAWSALLNCTVVSMSAAAVLAVVLDPALAAAAARPFSLPTAVSVVYPLLSLLLVAGVVGIAALHTQDARRGWIALVLGLLLFAGADVAVAVLGDRYVVGTALDALWPVGLALVAVWVDRSSYPTTPRTRQPSVIVDLAVPAVATTTCLGILVLASQTLVPTLAVWLASITLALAVIPLVSRERGLSRLSRTDDLTGLPNRRALYADVTASLDTGGDRPSALLLLDVDRFKDVNDSLGHDAGDRLLVEVGIRLAAALGPDDLLARLGGDEFAILLPGAGAARAGDLAERLRESLARPFVLEGIALQTSVSIGISLYPDHGADITALLRTADTAMYTAKASGGGGYRVYRTNDDRHGERRLRTLQELRDALDGNQLVLHYQPRIDIRAAEVRVVEAVVLWNHPDRGLLSADDFLDLVEDAGLVRAVSEAVFVMALDQAAAWHRCGFGLGVAIRLPAWSLLDTGLPEHLGSMLADRALPRNTLTLEVGEDFLLADQLRARTVLGRLRDEGVRTSVDDFGTGYSSLALLRDLAIDELRLDESFVVAMADDARSATLVRSAVDLAHSLGLRMVAEGVSDEAAFAALGRIGCDSAQGSYLSPPLPAGELDRWLAARTPTRARS